MSGDILIVTNEEKEGLSTSSVGVRCPCMAVHTRTVQNIHSDQAVDLLRRVVSNSTGWCKSLKTHVINPT